MNQKLLDLVLKSPRLPSLPTIALEVIELVQQQDIDIKHIAKTIQHDPALSSKILKMVNSSFYGQAQKVSTITHALVVLGLNSVKTLALGFSLVANLKDSGGDTFDLMSFWKRSIYSATAAKSLARLNGLVQQEEAFLGALLQDLGMLAMNQALDSEYRDLLMHAKGDHQKLVKLERQLLDTDHAEVGGALAESWNLPPLLAAPIRFHENPDEVNGNLAPLVRCVALGNRVADVFMSEGQDDSLDAYFQCGKQWFNISMTDAEPLLKAIHKDTNEVRRLFDLPTGELVNPDEILSRANEALMQFTLQSQQQQNRLQRQNQVLSKQALTDSLTGVANRRKFEEFSDQQFEQARCGTEPLSILFLDTDHFKVFNDTYGHLTGDRVLIEVAEVLRQMMPHGSLVARYGGEEFAVVLPNTDRKTAALLAEQSRKEIAATTVDSDAGEPLHITVSIGVATFDSEIFQRVEQLIKAADQGVYAAKDSGRNCVRIFTPRVKTVAA